MADTVTIHLTGFKELADALHKLPEAVADKLLNSAVFAGAKLVRDDAREMAPEDTGALRAGIVTKRVKEEKYDSEYIVTMSTKQMVKYVKNSRAAKMELQGPIAPVTINGRTFRASKLMMTKMDYEDWGDLFYGKFFEFGTSKMPARPYLRPAFEQNKEKAVMAIGKKLDESLQKHAAKLAKGSLK